MNQKSKKKRVQNGYPSRYQHLIAFWSILGCFLEAPGGILGALGTKLSPKCSPTCDPKNPNRILGDSGHPGASREAILNDFGTILDRFWSDFGDILGDFGERFGHFKWHSWIVQPSSAKIDFGAIFCRAFYRFLSDFGGSWASDSKCALSVPPLGQV